MEIENLTQHKQKFQKIVKKYNLDQPKKAEKISKYLTSEKNITLKNFSEKFSIPESESEIFLTFIHKGIQFKEQSIDPNHQ